MTACPEVDMMSRDNSINKKRLRKRLLVDPKVQGVLIERVVAYWGVCLLTITLMLLCWQVVTGPPQMFSMHLNAMWHNFGPALLASLLLLPLVVVDSIRLSNRFAGPLVRLRRSMRALADGETVEPIYFRDGDYWQEMADEFNAVAEQMRKLSEVQDEAPQELEPVGSDG